MSGVSGDRRCPICGAGNDCRIANGCIYKGACWCEAAIIPAPLQRHLANEFQQRACFCRECLRLLAHHAAQGDAAELIVSRVRAERIKQGADSYLDEMGRTVFTAAFHLRRGYCCGSGCRHCPFGGSLSQHDSRA